MLHRIMEVSTVEIAKTVKREEVKWTLLHFTVSLDGAFGFLNWCTFTV